MRAAIVVIANVLANDVVKMLLAENDELIQGLVFYTLHPVWSIYSAELQLVISIEVTNGLQKPISARR